MRILALLIVIVANASCGTLVQVVDARETPVPGASVQIIYLSINGPSAMTDSAGYARLGDAWFSRPLYSMVPQWVWIMTSAGKWSFNYPPPPVIRLEPSKMEQPYSPASQPAAAAGEPQAARG